MRIENLLENLVVLHSNERILDFKNSGFQFHYHENAPGKIASPKLKAKDKNLLKLSNYQAAMGDYYASKLGIRKICKGS